VVYAVTNRRGAFALLELMLAVAILAILMACAVPFARGSFRRLTLDDAAATLASRLRLAQARGVAESCLVRAMFDQSAGEYRLEYLPPGQGQAQFEPLPGPLGLPVQLPGGVVFSRVTLLAEDGVTQAQALVFHPDGRRGRCQVVLSSPAGQCQLELGDRPGQVLLTSVSPGAKP
jgi:prepilin-type N-terminal cleavage/methylation domain-containing protein